MLIGEQWLVDSERNAYREFLEEDCEEVEKSIRKKTSNGRPLGGDEFIDLLESRCGQKLRVQKKGRPKKEL